MRAYIIVDLGFGDSGKGLLTDFLVRHRRAGVVVRYNGGAQAGHNVVTSDGRHHTFSQFGSGMFVASTRTYLSRHVVIHPTALLIEGDILATKGVADPFSRIRVSDDALVITPFHQAANRIREIVRGADRHGSCGVGVGETVEDSLLYPENRIWAGDLMNPALLRRKLRSVAAQKREQIDALSKDKPIQSIAAREYEIFENETVIEAWISAVARLQDLGLVTPDSVLEDWLGETETAIFEGAQGVLLDQDAGFHPFTTWSRCTAANALELLEEMAPQSEIHRIGVMRHYTVRHGPGPLPTETDGLSSLIAEHNQGNEWQGPVRYGWFDAVLGRYALQATGGLDALAVTHLDLLPRLKSWQYCTAYRGAAAFSEAQAELTVAEGLLTNFHLPDSLSERTKFTQALLHAAPALQSCDASEETVLEKIESLIGQAVTMVSRGPRAGHVEVRFGSA